MFKFIRNIGCLCVIIFVVFFVFALLFGGGKIRQVGDKTTGIVKKAFYYAADRADEIHKLLFKKVEEMGKPLKDEKRDINSKKP